MSKKDRQQNNEPTVAAFDKALEIEPNSVIT
jgi:hypothetical protein